MYTFKSITAIIYFFLIAILISCDASNDAGIDNKANENLPELSWLNIQDISLDQIFQSSQTEYTASVGYLVNRVKLTALSNEIDSRLTINGNSVSFGNYLIVPLLGSENSVKIIISGQNGSRTYHVMIKRESSDVFSQKEFLSAFNADRDDRLGTSIAIYRNTMVVGAFAEDGDGSNSLDNSAKGAGAVYVYRKESGAWILKQYLKASNASAYDNFGQSVAIDGDTIVVGAPNQSGSGAVYIFKFSYDKWFEESVIKSSVADAGDNFGGSVAIQSRVVVIGASGDDGDGSSLLNNGVTDSGAVYLFSQTGIGWIQRQYLKASDIDAFSNFGYSVSMSEGRVAVSARSASPSGSGAVYVFDKVGGGWEAAQRITASNQDANDFFGEVVSLSGDTLAVSTINEDSNGSSDANNDAQSAGAVYVFLRDTNGQWNQQQYIKASDARAADLFGISLSLDKNWLAVGAWNNGSIVNSSVTENAGSVFLYQRVDNVWRLEKRLGAGVPDAFSLFGSSVDLDIVTGTLVVGESRNGADTGAAYVFQ